MSDYDKSKIIISNIGFEVALNEKGSLNLSDSLSYILGDKNDYDNFFKLINSNLIKFILKYYKNNTLHDLYKLMNKNLYYIPLKECYTDYGIYSYFNLTKDEIELIENNLE
jgi:hypothetical protein